MPFFSSFADSGAEFGIGHDLVVVAVHHQDRHHDLLQVLGEIGLGKGDDAVVVRPGASHLRSHLPQIIRSDDRPGASESSLFWSGNLAEVGHFIFGYESLWLPQSLLRPERQRRLADALFAASRHAPVELHFQKGLAGSSSSALAATRDTATNPRVLDAFVLAIVGGEGPPAYLGIPGHEPDLAAGRKTAREVARAIGELRKLAPGGGSYFAESNFFETEWQKAYWGASYSRLREVKRKYDPDCLFFVHHGAGSEGWSADGFRKLTAR